MFSQTQNSGTEETSFIETLAADYARIFLGAGINDGKAAFPYESVYTSPKRLIMQESWEQVRTIYARRQFICQGSLMEDHMALELEFMAHLCDETAESLTAARPKTALKDSLTIQKNFLDSHLLRWCTDFCQDILKLAETDLYRGLALATESFLKADTQFLEAFMNGPIV